MLSRKPWVKKAVGDPAPKGLVEVQPVDNVSQRYTSQRQTSTPAASCAPKPLSAPGAPITLLFSDIVASTRRWEGDPDAMTVDLARHDELLRICIDNAGGEVFCHTGDGMGAAFITVADAVAAALAAQRALTTATWAAAGPLRVRMAIHVGAAQRREGNYFGPSLNRVARLLGTASGGQVLCSQAVAELIGPHLPLEVTLIDLGEHRLADLSRPERVFQVNHPDLPSQFPPLRSLGAHRHNLPVSLTSFVGRTGELDEISRLLAGSRLLTLTGVGGVGKTRLALQWAAGVLPAYCDGVWVVELVSVRHEAQVASAVAAALSLETSAFDTSQILQERLMNHLAARQTLLLMDNCEHLIEGVARLVQALVTHCPGVTVLSTSRERLGVPGEVVWSVPPLSLPRDRADVEEVNGSDAAAFFCERARAARSTFELDHTNVTTVARICRRLDGIPLALELAAAWIQMLSPIQIARRLEDRFRLMTSRKRIVVPHQQTLRATIDWSYELLSPPEQRALAALGVFPDTFDFEAAEAVISGEINDIVPDDALDVLCGLINKSLVVVHSEDRAPRYRLLETIRQYSIEKLAEAGKEAAVRQRHRNTFVTLVKTWKGTPLGADFLWGTFTEAENLSAALDWSWTQRDADAMLHLIGALWMPWLWFGNPNAHVWIQRILSEPEFSAPELTEHPGHIDALNIQAVLLPSNDHQRRNELFEEAAALARRIGDDRRLVITNWTRSEYSLVPGKGAQARALFHALLTDGERLGLPDGVAWCHDHLGWAALVEGDYHQAQSHFERAIDVARSDSLGEWVEPHALAALSPLIALTGDKERALHLAEQAIAAARRLPARPVLAMALTRGAETAVLVREPRRAAVILAELLSLITDLGTQRWLADALETTALVLETEQDREQAATILGASDRLREATGEARGGVRIIAEQVRHLRDWMIRVLGTERFALHETRGRELSCNAVVALALDSLTTCEPN